MAAGPYGSLRSPIEYWSTPWPWRPDATATEQEGQGGSTLVGMDDLRIEPSPGSRDGIRLLKLIGPFTLKHVFEFRTAVRKDAARLTIIDLTASAVHGLGGPGLDPGLLFKVAGVDGVLVPCSSVAEAEGKLASSASA